ncbi:transmembrane protein 242 isoform X3 [Oryzias latipes]|uniref:transmembrane protein 242 isoform X3 n=1 Tax=Oryzias latipes TaxID=8090 RepID=UPI000CE1D5A1|nr:transmembrane protein 242 isoform X3 [Oryzias latipes]
MQTDHINMTVVEEEGSTESRRRTDSDGETDVQMLTGAVFLTMAASAGMVAGFGSTVALAKKKSPEWFRRGSTRKRRLSGPPSSGLGLPAGLVWGWSAQRHGMEGSGGPQSRRVQAEDAELLPVHPKDPGGGFWLRTCGLGFCLQVQVILFQV